MPLMGYFVSPHLALVAIWVRDPWSKPFDLGKEKNVNRSWLYAARNDEKKKNIISRGLQSNKCGTGYTAKYAGCAWELKSGEKTTITDHCGKWWTSKRIHGFEVKWAITCCWSRHLERGCCLVIKTQNLFFLVVVLYDQGRSYGGSRGGHCPPKIVPGPPSGPPKNFQVSFWKSYTDHWQLPLLQNWPLQWPPQMKMSGSAPVYDACLLKQ